MKLFEQEINCRQLESYKYSNRIKPFKMAVFQFDYKSNDIDKSFLDKIFNKGTILAEKVNPAAANNASYKRNRIRLNNEIRSEPIYQKFNLLCNISPATKN